MVDTPGVMVVARGNGWARLRVRGLLRNTAFARRLQASAPRPLAVLAATGSVRVRLDIRHDEAYWLTWLESQRGSVAAPASAGAQRTRGATSRVTHPAPRLRRAEASEEPRARPAMDSHATARDGNAEHAARARDIDPAPHALRWPEPLTRFGTEGRPLDVQRGLDPTEVATRLARDGANEILDIAARSDVEILLDQFTSVPVALLGVSAAVSLATRAWADAGAIGAVLGVNGTIGFVTERRAEQTISSLRRLGPRQARVLRGAEILTINAREIVVGDVLILQPGDPVPADARVFESHRLAANEAALTGESLPVRKEPCEALPAGAPLGERRNMVFMGTVISGGMGRAVVTGTGEHTALGQIRRLAQIAVAPRTRLQTELDTLGKRLGLGAAALCGLVFALGALRGRPLLPLLRIAVSLGVAAIPEGLPTVATSLLASSVRKLRDQQIYARSLDAVENLGAVDTVCFDKTGTLTQNRMTVTAVAVGGEVIDVATGDDAKARGPGLPPDALRVAMLCHTVERGANGSGPWHGSSTEIALLEYAAGRGADFDALQRRHPQLSVRHRSEHHPYMVTLHADARGLFVAVKGRPDAVLERCKSWFDGRSVQPLTAAARKRLLALNQQLAGRGQRVLAFACRRQPGRRYGETGGLTWLGLAGMADPLRPGLPEMVGRFRAAGIRPLMITGDQLGTASVVARGVGLEGGKPLVDAAMLPEAADEIAPLTEATNGFARTSPAMKLEIVRALQRGGHVVAMTGDGINDGPALKVADVGVAMGVSGTDFAHAMSDLVLRDDHPAAILKAIEQGRTTFVNIRKSVRYLVATNLSELATTTIAVAAGLPEPLDARALLWTNIVTDIWPAIALGLEPAEPGILERPPVALGKGLLERREWAGLGIDAAVMTAATLASFGFGLVRYGVTAQPRTMAFMTLTSSQLLYALAMRSSRPLRGGGLQPNRLLNHAVGWSLLAQTGTLFLPPMRRLLGTTPLRWPDLLVVAATAATPLLVREGLKERPAAKTAAARRGIAQATANTPHQETA